MVGTALHVPATRYDAETKQLSLAFETNLPSIKKILAQFKHRNMFELQDAVTLSFLQTFQEIFSHMQLGKDPLC